MSNPRGTAILLLACASGAGCTAADGTAVVDARVRAGDSPQSAIPAAVDGGDDASSQGPCSAQFATYNAAAAVWKAASRAEDSAYSAWTAARDAFWSCADASANLSQCATQKATYDTAYAAYQAAQTAYGTAAENLITTFTAYTNCTQQVVPPLPGAGGPQPSRASEDGGIGDGGTPAQ